VKYLKKSFFFEFHGVIYFSTLCSTRTNGRIFPAHVINDGISVNSDPNSVASFNHIYQIRAGATSSFKLVQGVF